MRPRNMVYTGPMIDIETEHAHLQPQPDPCLIPYHHGPLPSDITFIAGPPGPRLFPFMAHNQLTFPNHHANEEAAHDAFKGKIDEGFHVNFHYSYPAPPGSGPFIGPEFQRFDVIPVTMARGVHVGAIDLNTGLQFMPMNHGGLAPPVQVVPGPWLDQPFSGSVPGIPYMQGYTNGSLVPFVRQPPPTMPPLPPVPRFVRPAQPIGVRVFQPHGQELILESNSRQRGLPHLRVLPEDGVAMLDFPNYGQRVDHHRDMRLDIDHMSYEELLALGERIGNAGSGLSGDFILGHLKTRIFISSRVEDLSSAHQDLTLCAICQMDYSDQEKIGILDCKHEYHEDCIEKWLVEKNTCPVCKCTALATQGKVEEP